jgi:hypothetical protein
MQFPVARTTIAVVAGTELPERTDPETTTSCVDAWPASETRLADLALEIREACAQRARFEEAARRAAVVANRLRLRSVLYAIRLGQLLREAHQLIGHGHWLKWLDERGLKSRTAQEYIQLSEAIDAGLVNARRVARLSFRSAMKLVRSERARAQAAQGSAAPEAAESGGDPLLRSRLSALKAACARLIELARWDPSDRGTALPEPARRLVRDTIVAIFPLTRRPRGPASRPPDLKAIGPCRIPRPYGSRRKLR